MSKETKREKALRIQTELNAINQKKINLKKELKKIQEELDQKDEEFKEAHTEYLCEKYNLKVGDVIECDGDEYQFVRFNFTNPIVHHKLKNGKWSKREMELHMYDFDKKTRKLEKVTL